MATPGSGAEVKLWNIASGKRLHTLRGHQQRVQALTFSADGKVLASAGEDATIRLWDVATGKERACFAEEHHYVYNIAFSPDGRYLAWSVLGVLRVVELGGGQELPHFGGHATSVKALAFSPDGRRLAAQSHDRMVTNGVRSVADGGAIRIWDIQTGRQISILRDASFPAAFSADGRALAAVGPDRSIVLWDAATGRPIRRWPDQPAVALTLRFSADGKILTAGLKNGDVGRWDVKTGQRLDRMTVAITPVQYEFSRWQGRNEPAEPPDTCFMYSADSRVLATLSLEGGHWSPGNATDFYVGSWAKQRHRPSCESWSRSPRST